MKLYKTAVCPLQVALRKYHNLSQADQALYLCYMNGQWRGGPLEQRYPPSPVYRVAPKTRHRRTEKCASEHASVNSFWSRPKNTTPKICCRSCLNHIRTSSPCTKMFYVFYQNRFAWAEPCQRYLGDVHTIRGRLKDGFLSLCRRAEKTEFIWFQCDGSRIFAGHCSSIVYIDDISCEERWRSHAKTSPDIGENDTTMDCTPDVGPSNNLVGPHCAKASFGRLRSCKSAKMWFSCYIIKR